MKLFFSWQSDIPEVKTYIRKTLQKICGELEIEYDEDSRGEDSAEYILDNILRKLDNAKIVVGDLTAIGTNIAGEKIPNPNLSFEVGYAEARVSRKNLIMVFCVDYGTHDDLPFDLSKRSMPSFSLKDKVVQRLFESKLRKAIKKIIEQPAQVNTERYLSIYEKTLLYWAHNYEAPIQRSNGAFVLRRNRLRPHGSFSYGYGANENEFGRYDHAVRSLVNNDLLIETTAQDTISGSVTIYVLSLTGEEAARRIDAQEVKRFFTEKI